MEKRLGRDEEIAFEALLREHSNSLLALLHAALDDRHAIDDLLQETCLIAWRKLDTYDPSRPFGPWLRGIARKLLLGHRRKWRLHLSDQGLEQVEQRLQVLDVSDTNDGEDRLEVVRHCLSVLPEKYRSVVVVKYFEGLSLEDAAIRLELSFEGVKKRLFRARSLIRECMQRKGYIVGSENLVD